MEVDISCGAHKPLSGTGGSSGWEIVACERKIGVLHEVTVGEYQQVTVMETGSSRTMYLRTDRDGPPLPCAVAVISYTASVMAW